MREKYQFCPLFSTIYDAFSAKYKQYNCFPHFYKRTSEKKSRKKSRVLFRYIIFYLFSVNFTNF